MTKTRNFSCPKCRRNYEFKTVGDVADKPATFVCGVCHTVLRETKR